MVGMTCLDTDLMIELLRNNEDAISFVQKLYAENELICTTIFNEYELWAGAFLRPGQEMAVEQLLERTLILYPDRKSAKAFGKIGAQLIKNGSQMPETDLMIASVALEHGEPIATRNEKHFSKIAGLKVVRW